MESEPLRLFESVFWVAGCGQVIHVIRSDGPFNFDCILREDFNRKSFKLAVSISGMVPSSIRLDTESAA
jgi:hypothetical protein